MGTAGQETHTPLCAPTGHPGARRPLRVGLLNLMPDHNLAAAHAQFASLLEGPAMHSPIELRGYVLPGTGPGPAAKALGYHDGEMLYRDQPEAVLVTGAEPSESELDREPYWTSLSHAIMWAEATVPSTLLSCLASHAALQILDGIRRSRQERKRCGMLRQRVDLSHPLARGLGPSVELPHSRWNDVPQEAIHACGYSLVVASDEREWTVAQRTREGRALVLLQGHPEYSRTTLLREYRRDTHRFATGRSDVYPDIPSGYLDAEGVRLLLNYRAAQVVRPLAGHSSPFPFDAVSRHIVASWQAVSTKLFANWLMDARRRVDAGDEVASVVTGA